ncbi:hypothetical protein MMC13_006802 [Lambiella insularis]|nr:hypothetical protein [Lambiella insularis]
MPDSTKHPVEITFRSPGAQPPVYVTGAFTTPPWHPIEMEYHSTQGDRPNEYLFLKYFQVAEGNWQYKFRLGSGDWWVCDESTEIVCDEIGNPNNLLVVSGAHANHNCVNKRMHAKPLSQTGSPDQVSAWEVEEIDSPSSSSTRKSRTTHQSLKGHTDPRCSREDSGEALTAGLVVDDGFEHEHEDVSDRIQGNHKCPLFAYSKATSVHTSLPSIAIPAPNTETGSTNAQITEDGEPEDHDERKISSNDIERVKLLMSMPDLKAVSISDVAVYDTGILDLDRDFDATQLTPGTIESSCSSHSPLLPHERLTCEDAGNDGNHLPAKSPLEKHSVFYIPNTALGPLTPPVTDEKDDPNVELFPLGAQNILQRMATLQEELPPDDRAVYEDEESVFDSLPPFTKDAPTLAHELPPIGSPEDRRRLASVDLSKFPTSTDGSSDIRLRDETLFVRDTSQFLPLLSLECNIRDTESRKDSLGHSFANGKQCGNEEEPLLADQSTSVSSYATLPKFSMGSEGARLRNSKSTDLDIPEEDAFSIASFNGTIAESVWRSMLAWLSSIWAFLFGIHSNK